MADSLGNVISTLLGLLQISQQRSSMASSQKLHEVEVELAKHLHEIEKNINNKQHSEAIKQNKIFHQSDLLKSNYMQLLDLEMQYKSHIQSYALDLISASRESERDMYEQISARMGYVLVAASIMLGALCTLLFGSTFNLGLNPSVSDFWVIFFLLFFSASSFGWFLNCIIKCLRVVYKLTTYMSYKSKKNFENVYDYIDDNFKEGYQMKLSNQIIDHGKRDVFNARKSVFEDTASLDNIFRLSTANNNINSFDSNNLLDEAEEDLRDVMDTGIKSPQLLRDNIKEISKSLSAHSNRLYSSMVRNQNGNDHSNPSWMSTPSNRLKSWCLFLFCIKPKVKYDDDDGANNDSKYDEFKGFDEFRTKHTKNDEKSAEMTLQLGTFSLFFCFCFWVWESYPSTVMYDGEEWRFWPKYVFIAILGIFSISTFREILKDPDFGI